MPYCLEGFVPFIAIDSSWNVDGRSSNVILFSCLDSFGFRPLFCFSKSLHHGSLMPVVFINIYSSLGDISGVKFSINCNALS